MQLLLKLTFSHQTMLWRNGRVCRLRGSQSLRLPPHAMSFATHPWHECWECYEALHALWFLWIQLVKLGQWWSESIVCLNGFCCELTSLWCVVLPTVSPFLIPKAIANPKFSRMKAEKGEHTLIKNCWQRDMISNSWGYIVKAVSNKIDNKFHQLHKRSWPFKILVCLGENHIEIGNLKGPMEGRYSIVLEEESLGSRLRFAGFFKW